MKVKMYQNNLNDAVGIISELNCCYDGLRVGFDYAQDIDATKYLLCNNGDIQIRNGVSKACAMAWTNLSNGKNTFEVNMDGKNYWWIKFYVNDKLYGRMEIANRHTYYPILVTTNSGQYQVLM